MLLDLHNHTRHSPDSRVRPKDLVAVAKRAGLGGVAITDHNSISGIEEAQAAADAGFLVIPGLEVSTLDGHVLAYGIREVVPRNLSVAETIEQIEARGGVAVAAHPYRFWSGLGEEALARGRFRAYETSNARTLRRGNERARRTARRLEIGETGGSDSHFLEEIAMAATVVEGDLSGVDSVLQAVGQGKTTSQGRNRGAVGTARYVSKCVSEWMVRGFHRI
jgi:predicted metal-dependent phosphoesterase TrpH